MLPPGADEPPQECHLKHPAQVKGAVFPAAAILQVACAGEKAAAKEDTGLAGPAVSAAGAPMVQRTVPLFNGLPASIDRGDLLDIRARQRALLRTRFEREHQMIEAGEARIRPTAVHHRSGGRLKWRQPQVPGDWRSQGGARFPCIEIRIVPLLKATQLGD